MRTGHFRIVQEQKNRIVQEQKNRRGREDKFTIPLYKQWKIQICPLSLATVLLFFAQFRVTYWELRDLTSLATVLRYQVLYFPILREDFLLASSGCGVFSQLLLFGRVGQLVSIQ